MIYKEYINPAQAKPGDFMFIKDQSDYFKLSMCVATMEYGKQWRHVKSFFQCNYDTEIIDGKPTPALIARFTSAPGSGKRFDVDCKSTDEVALVKTPSGILEITAVKPFQDFFYFGVRKFDSIYDGTNLREYRYQKEAQAETERARLIEWLEGA